MMKVSYDKDGNLLGYGDCICKPIGWNINREKDEKEVKKIVDSEKKKKKEAKIKYKKAIDALIAKQK